MRITDRIEGKVFAPIEEDMRPVAGANSRALPPMRRTVKTPLRKYDRVLADVAVAAAHAQPVAGRDGLAACLHDYAAKQPFSEIQQHDALVRLLAWGVHEAVRLEHVIAQRKREKELLPR